MLLNTYESILDISSTLVPLSLCYRWHKLDTSEGFSGLYVVANLLVHICRVRLRMMTTTSGLWLPITEACVAAAFVLIFDFYHVHKRGLHMQLTGLAISVTSIGLYVDGNPVKEQPIMMQAFCDVLQVVLAGALVYEGYRIIFDLKGTEFMPLSFTMLQLMIACPRLVLAWLLTDNRAMISRSAMVGACCFVFCLYLIYPHKAPVKPKKPVKPQPTAQPDSNNNSNAKSATKINDTKIYKTHKSEAKKER